MQMVTLDQYAHLPRPNVDWLVQGLIPRPGMVMLLGPPKAGKSFLALDIANRISRGQDVLGHKSKPVPVLYIQMDTSEAIWRDRILCLEQSGYDTRSPRMLMAHPDQELRPLNVLTASGAAWIRDALHSSKAELVVLDVLREIHTGDENDSTEMKKVFDELARLFAGRTVLFVHHTRKIDPAATKVDPVAIARGSSYITGKMDAYWLLYDQRLHLTSRFAEERTLRAVQSKSGIWEFPELAVPAASVAPAPADSAAPDSLAPFESVLPVSDTHPIPHP